MFDDCNTFFKGKPDGRDGARTGVPHAGAVATPGDGRQLRASPLRNSYISRKCGPFIRLRQRGHVPKFRAAAPDQAWAADRPEARVGPCFPRRKAAGACRSTGPPQGRPKAVEQAFPSKVSRDRSDRNFARVLTFSRSSPPRTPSRTPAWRRASAERSRT